MADYDWGFATYCSFCEMKEHRRGCPRARGMRNGDIEREQDYNAAVREHALRQHGLLPRADDVWHCGACFADVAPDNAAGHARWHEELDRAIMRAFYAGSCWHEPIA